MEVDYRGQKAVVYARYSSSSQTEQSIEGQLRDAYDFAEKHGIIIINEYIDRAQSGTSDARKAFQKMIRDAERKQFSLILVWKLDRYARNREDAAIYRAKLKRLGVKIVSIMENIPDGSEGILVAAVMEGMAEYFSRNLSENIKRGQRESVLKGWYPGGKVPYGYQHIDHHLVPDSEKAPIVQEIFERYSHGERTSLIVKDLQERGVHFSPGHYFSLNSIDRLLDNTVYIGELRYGGRIVEGCAEPLISREMFQMAVARRNANRRAPAARRKPTVKFHLLGKLFCGECGKNMAGDSGTGKHKESHYYYTCHKRKNHQACSNKRLRKDEIEYIICKVISDFLTDKNRKVLEIMAECMEKEFNSGFEQAEINELQIRLDSIEKSLDKLVDSLMQMPEKARPRIAQRMEELETEREDVEAQLAKRRLESDDRFTKEDFLSYLRLMVTDLEEESNRIFIIEKFLDCAYSYNDGRLVIYIKYLNHFPHAYDPDDPIPGKDGYKEGKKIFDGKIPKGLASLPDIRRGSTLCTYAVQNAGKLEPRLPHMFFLNGKLGIVAWLKDIR